MINNKDRTFVLFCGKSFSDDLRKALDIIHTKPMQTENPPIKTGRSFYLDINKLNDIRKFRKNRK